MRREEVRFTVMGSQAHLVLLDAPEGLVRRARRRLDDLERRWSRFLADSELSQINRSASRPVVVSRETFQVIADAVEAWRWSEGRFDPTVGRTMELAGYDRPRSLGAGSPGQRSTPVTARSERAPVTARFEGAPVTARHEPCPTPAELRLDPYPGSVTVPEGMVLDLGGIGKGAAADLVVDEMLSAGAAGCCVNLGGDVRVAGQAPHPEGWQIALGDAVPVDDAPQDDRGRSPVVGVVDGAVCTSTRTRRTWVGSSGAEHHLRDPATGAPADTGLTTVTVISARAAQAEVLAKTAFLAGPIEAAGLIADAGATGVLITDDGDAVHLPGLDPFLAVGSAARPVVSAR